MSSDYSGTTGEWRRDSVKPSVQPPVIRNERVDWHALTNMEQHQVLAWKNGLDINQCSLRARKFLERHHGA